MPSWFMRAWREIQEGRRHRSGGIDLTNTGFRYSHNKRETDIAWDAINRIEAGVRAMITVDALYVRITAGATVVQIDEFSTDGFGSLEKEIFARWPETQGPWRELQQGVDHQDRSVVLWSRS